MGDSFGSSSNVYRQRKDDKLQEKTWNKSIVQPYYRSRVPRLPLTSELHQCFVNAVQRLGGATPKMIMQIMDVKGLTVSHIKSHLQVTVNTDSSEDTSSTSSSLVNTELTSGGPYTCASSSCSC